MGIGVKIREQRLKLGITQQELARSLGVTPSAVGNYECEVSFPKEKVLLRLFDTLECTPNELFGGECENALSPREAEHLNKYRELDERGKSLVDGYTERELLRMEASAEDGEEIPIAARNGSAQQLKLKKLGNKSISELPDYRGGRR